AVACQRDAPARAAGDDNELCARIDRAFEVAEELPQQRLGRCVERDADEVETVDRIAAVDRELELARDGAVADVVDVHPGGVAAEVSRTQGQLERGRARI